MRLFRSQSVLLVIVTMTAVAMAEKNLLVDEEDGDDDPLNSSSGHEEESDAASQEKQGVTTGVHNSNHQEPSNIPIGQLLYRSNDPIAMTFAPLLQENSMTVRHNDLLLFVSPSVRSFAEYRCSLQSMNLLSIEEAAERLLDILHIFRVKNTVMALQMWVKGEPCQRRWWTRTSKASLFSSSSFDEKEEESCRTLTLLHNINNQNSSVFTTSKDHCGQHHYTLCV